jgi:hypothetical protein
VQLQVQAPDYESLLDVLDAAGQEQRLVTFVEGLMCRQIALDESIGVSAQALHRSSMLWQSLYQSLQSGVVFVRRRPSAPPFKLPRRQDAVARSPLSSRRNSISTRRNSASIMLRTQRSSFSFPTLDFSKSLSQAVESGTESPSSARSRRSSLVGVASASGLSSGAADSDGDARETAGGTRIPSAPAHKPLQMQRRRSFVDVP